MWRYALPLTIFLAVAVFLGLGLEHDPRALPSAMLDKPAPAIDRPILTDPSRTLAVADLRGKVTLINVWASWCQPCQQEAPFLRQMAQQTGIPLYGINYKDKPADALAWLKANGNPYIASASDLDGRVGMEYGVYGVPETFVIDAQGRIRYRHLGILTPESWQKQIEPVLKAIKP